MRVTTYTEARGSLKQIMDAVTIDHDPTLIHRRNGGNVVMLSEDDYNAMQETLYLLSSPANARMLAQSIAEYQQGKTVSHALVEE